MCGGMRPCCGIVCWSIACMPDSIWHQQYSRSPGTCPHPGGRESLCQSQT
jgi:hypothetical protein